MSTLSPVELRHKLHQIPELAFEEFETTKLIKESISKLDKKKKLKFHQPLETGLLVEYKPNDTNDFSLFRADIDALNIKEETDYEYKSQNENMHACGHDFHSSVLYGFLKNVIDAKPDKNLLFLFQPAEEGGGGAIEFFKTDIFSQFNIKNAFALHVTDEYPEGTVASTAGVLFASAIELDIEFIGESAHVAFPHQGENAFDALRKFLDEIDDLKKEITEPFVFAPGKIYAGEVRNITPGTAKLECTMRGLSVEKVLDFYNRIEKTLAKIKEETGIDYELTSGSHYPEVIVDKNLFEKLKPSLENEFEFIDCGHKMTGEDFGFFSKKYPSFMFWLGTQKGEQYGLHNPKFLPDDSSIEVGIKVFKNILANL